MSLPTYNHSPTYVYRAKVLRIIDGDTFEVALDFGFRMNMERSIRVRGIDTPERFSKYEVERIHANQARDFVAKLLPLGSTVVLISAKMAIYDRIEADVFYNDPATGAQHSLSDALRANGFAKRASYT